MSRVSWFKRAMPSLSKLSTLRYNNIAKFRTVISRDVGKNNFHKENIAPNLAFRSLVYV